MLYILPDTGFWYGLCVKRDQHREDAESLRELIERNHIVVPWPIVHETLCTQFVKNTAAIETFNKYIRRGNLTFLNDTEYVEDAYQLSVTSSLEKCRWLSMVDSVIRLILADEHVRIHALITFNRRDFEDVCRRRKIDILP